MKPGLASLGDTGPRSAVDRLFDPRVIAVVGATPDMSFSRNMLTGLRSAGYRGQVYAVNPGRGTVFGWPAFPAVAALPETPDLGVILVGAKDVPTVMRQLAERGCCAAYILASGFETADDLSGLKALAAELGMLVLGPNCNGYVRPDAGLYIWTGPGARPYKQGALSIIAQSSGIIESIRASAWDRGLGFSAMIATGNQVNFSLADALLAQADNKDTRVVVCYIEQFGDFALFARAAARCRSSNIAVVAITSGASQAARQVTLSHTGALSTGPDISAAALEAAGVIQANDVDEALDYASLFAQLPRRAWHVVRNVGVVAISGGFAAQTADALAAHGLVMPPIPPEVQEVVPNGVPRLNPMDITGRISARMERYPPIIDRFVQSKVYDAVVVMIGLYAGLERWFAPVGAWAYQADKPVLLGTNETLALSDSMREMLDRSPMPHIAGTARIARALAGLRLYHSLKSRIPEGWRAEPVTPWTGRPIAQMADLAPSLREAGVEIVPSQEVDTKRPVFPSSLGRQLVLKLESPELPHKTEFDAVRYPVSEVDFVRVVAELVAISAERNIFDWTVVAQTYVDDAELEILVGAIVDPTVGPVLTVALGGTLAEILKRSVHAVCPIDRDVARDLLDRLGIAPIMAGYRGKPPLDSSIFDLIASVSEWAYRHRGDLRELDLNPILLRRSGSPALVVDALARFSRHD
jgi:acetate---CoA ligase (ADP-forming)